MLIARQLTLAALICLSSFTAPAGMQSLEAQDARGPANAAARTERKLPGMQPGGSTLLPSQWSLKPSGKHISLGDYPVNMAFHPKEDFIAVLHAGYGEHEIIIVEPATMRIVSRASLPETFVGLAFTSDGKSLYASGAEKEVIHRFRFEKGYLSAHETLAVVDVKERQIPAGVALNAEDTKLYAACPWGNSVAVLDTAHPEQKRLIALRPDDYPYSVLPDPSSSRLFVSLWGAAAVAVLNRDSNEVAAHWNVSANPTEMLLSKDSRTLFVACANSNVVHVVDTESGKTLEIISSALYPKAPNGSTPNSIALSADEKVLLIANATNNNAAVIDVSERGRSRSLGFIPLGWYPTCIRFSPHDGKIYVTNGKGMASKANRLGPNPINDPPKTTREYIGGLFTGTLSQIDPPSPTQMAQYTKTAFECSPLRGDNAPVGAVRDPNHPIPISKEKLGPIENCIYVIKENRTYDQVLGDMRQGNGDPSLCIFPENVTPNQHAIASEFVLLDNFYVESEVSADGHEWSMAAYANDFVEKVWPLSYRGSREGKLKYPAEGNFKIAEPSSGYIWDRAKAAGVTYRSYGEFVSNGDGPGKPAVTRIESLKGHFDPDFHGYDLNYPDAKRVDRFVSELRRFEKAGAMPRLQIVRLPNDHTAGTAVGKLTPTAMVAENDLALGKLVEAVSHSSFWSKTAIFVVEDDAQNGSDHVDAHRTIAFVISPYTKRGYVDSNMYSTSSMLRTMELILGMDPMTQFDAAALPMFDSFTPQADLTPFVHEPAQVDLTETNKPDAWGAKLTATFDLSREDAADDLLFNEVIWRSVRGPNSPMPAPVRAGFVFADGDADEEEEEEEEEDEEEETEDRVSEKHDEDDDHDDEDHRRSK